MNYELKTINGVNRIRNKVLRTLSKRIDVLFCWEHLLKAHWNRRTADD